MDELREQIRHFVAERDWQQFHTPKNLATALCIEAGELAEIFLWLTPEESKNLPPEKLQAARDEIGDVLIYLIRVADELGVDLHTAAEQKLEKARLKYPADQVRGKALKYTEYE